MYTIDILFQLFTRINSSPVTWRDCVLIAGIDVAVYPRGITRFGRRSICRSAQLFTIAQIYIDDQLVMPSRICVTVAQWAADDPR